jgi:hypothetical protein
VHFHTKHKQHVSTTVKFALGIGGGGGVAGVEM